jgi:hypothetical protein
MRASKQFASAGLAVILTIAASGCGSSSNSGGSRGTSMDAMADQLDAQNAARKQTEAAAAAKAAADQKAADAQAAQNPPEPEKKVAGRGQVQFGGYYGAIAGARRHIMDKLDRLPWLQAVQHFQATEGRLPKDHAEFMKKVVEPLGINLGHKEEDQEFLYDPSVPPWGELYVVAKVTAETPPPAAEQK